MHACCAASQTGLGQSLAQLDAHHARPSPSSWVAADCHLARERSLTGKICSVYSIEQGHARVEG